MESNISSLREMQERMSAWMNEKQQFFDNSNDLRLQPNDLALVQFVANGDEGSRFLHVYRSHVIDRQGNNGKRFSDHRYCPLQSGEPSVDCPLCAQGHATIKERMSMWFYVHNILHTQLPKDAQFPLIQYENRNYFNEEINGFKVWHSSAWRDSPWGDILKLGELYKGLHNFTAQLIRYGANTDTRYKVIAIPQSAMLAPEVYQRAHEECKPLLDILHEQIGGQVQAAPQMAPVSTINAQSAPPTNIQPFAAPGQSVPTLSVPPLQQSEDTGAEAPIVPITSPEDASRPMKKLF